MKKIICLVLVLVAVATGLCACADSDNVESTTTPAADAETSKRPSYAVKTPNDYDSDGNFILSSSENRVVYSYEGGYAVFTFQGSTVTKIQQVLSFEDEAAARAYTEGVAKDAAEKGEVPPTMAVNGKNVIVAVAFDNEMTRGSLSEYYIKTKADVIADFGADESL